MRRGSNTARRHGNRVVPKSACEKGRFWHKNQVVPRNSRRDERLASGVNAHQWESPRSANIASFSRAELAFRASLVLWDSSVFVSEFAFECELFRTSATAMADRRVRDAVRQHSCALTAPNGPCATCCGACRRPTCSFSHRRSSRTLRPKGATCRSCSRSPTSSAWPQR